MNFFTTKTRMEHFAGAKRPVSLTCEWGATRQTNKCSITFLTEAPRRADFVYYTMNDVQVAHLRWIYNHYESPRGITRELATLLGLRERQVVDWFARQRAAAVRRHRRALDPEHKRRPYLPKARAPQILPEMTRQFSRLDRKLARKTKK